MRFITNVIKRCGMADVDVVVIGSGAGGLTAALGCALAGKKVVIIEQHYLHRSASAV
jgi:succinate dehydrogenase/fumarate reductase flavoprotein subunit